MNDARGCNSARKLPAAALAVVLILSAQAAARAQTISAGTAVHAILSSPDLNTKNAKPGDGFTMVVIPPYPDGNAAFANATLHGHVIEARRAGQGRKADLKLGLDAITFANGQTQPVSGAVVGIETKKENTTVRKALGAGAGMAVGSQTIGLIAGGAAGGVLGILGGAIAGFLYANNNKANFDVPVGAKVTFQMTSPLEVPRRQALHQPG
jgi:opacity protein-like surface antigen